jgi:hypothetical protein
VRMNESGRNSWVLLRCYALKYGFHGARDNARVLFAADQRRRAATSALAVDKKRHVLPNGNMLPHGAPKVCEDLSIRSICFG